jgi:hypothetical protein
MIKTDFQIGIAFLRGNPQYLWDHLIMDTTNGPFVHTELFLQNRNDIRFYTSVNPTNSNRRGGFMPSARLQSMPNPVQWEIISFPISKACYRAAYAFVLQLISMQLPYNSYDLWQCCVGFMLPFEHDLDCERPVTWQRSGVFCSQVCLLFLRRLSKHGLIPGRPGLTSMNSRGCSPNHLYKILNSKKKKDIES